MVKPSRVLDDARAEAEIPYEETRLAKRAPAARRRLVGLLLVGTLALGIEAVLTSPFWSLAAAGTALAAWALWKERLGGIIATAFAGLVATGLALATLGMAHPGGSTFVATLVALVLGAATLPDVLLLARDAELQNAYGRWARRDA